MVLAYNNNRETLKLLLVIYNIDHYSLVISVIQVSMIEGAGVSPYMYTYIHIHVHVHYYILYRDQWWLSMVV